MIRTAVITLASTARLDHARAQWIRSRDHPELTQVVAWLDETPPPSGLPGLVVHVPPGEHGMRLAAARNAGALAARDTECDLLVFLDADCIPGPALFDRYRAASLEHPDAVLCGPVTYLPECFSGTDAGGLTEATRPHLGRPNPPETECVVAEPEEYDLFWSLSFATTAFTWQRAGGFSESYEGYGGEDTDFGQVLLERGIPLVWVGGAHAYHQYHHTSSPPWQHLDDILRNAAVYHRHWGRWPMEGWLRAFADAGAITFADGRWMRVPEPRAHA